MSLLVLFNQGHYAGPWDPPRGNTVSSGSRTPLGKKTHDGTEVTIFAKLAKVKATAQKVVK